MLSFLAEKISCFLVEQSAIESSDKEVYVYGMEILLSTLLNTLAILLVALLFNMAGQITFFIVPFILVRMTAGGYHAKSHARCVSILLATLIVFVTLIKCVQPQVLHIFTLPALLVSAAIILVLSPVEDVNRPFTEKEVFLFRRRSLIVSLILTVIAIASYYAAKTYWISFSISLGICVASLSLIAEYVKNKGLETVNNGVNH